MSPYTSLTIDIPLLFWECHHIYHNMNCTDFSSKKEFLFYFIFNLSYNTFLIKKFLGRERQTVSIWKQPKYSTMNSESSTTYWILFSLMGSNRIKCVCRIRRKYASTRFTIFLMQWKNSWGIYIYACLAYFVLKVGRSLKYLK